MASSPTQTSHFGRQMRPPQLPPPTVLPLRYCSHNEDSTPIDEAECLLSLLSPSEGIKKNKEHYILASADPPTPPETKNDSQRRKGAQARPPPPPPQQRYNLRRDARLIPGVPIIYVKRSVMVLEPLSGVSEGIRNGVERGKLRTGFAAPAVNGKRKRGCDGDGDGDGGDSTAVKSGGSKKTKGQKGANPLSMLKSKKKDKQPTEKKSEKKQVADQKEKTANDPEAEKSLEDGDPATKTKRKRRHKRHKADGEEASAETAVPIPSES